MKAVKKGHILVIDEADKAPTNVTCILKTLVESGEMILSDGRRLVAGKCSQRVRYYSTCGYCINKYIAVFNLADV